MPLFRLEEAGLVYLSPHCPCSEHCSLWGTRRAWALSTPLALLQLPQPESVSPKSLWPLGMLETHVLLLALTPKEVRKAVVDLVSFHTKQRLSHLTKTQR